MYSKTNGLTMLDGYSWRDMIQFDSETVIEIDTGNAPYNMYLYDPSELITYEFTEGDVQIKSYSDKVDLVRAVESAKSFFNKLNN